MRSANVYSRKGTFFVHASLRTTAGVWMDGAPSFAVEHASDDSSLGEAILAALAGSRQGVPHPNNWKEVQRALLELAGVKSWSTFTKGATHVAVQEGASGVTLTPTTNVGDGFESEDERAVTLERGTTAASIGALVRGMCAGS